MLASLNQFIISVCLLNLQEMNMELSADRLLEMYRKMVLIRKFEDRAAGFYREEIGRAHV